MDVRKHAGKRRVSAVTILVGLVAILLPALAYVQYQWLGQLSTAERERMQRTLRTAAAQFATEFDSELSKAVMGLQLEGAVVRDENWPAYAQRYATWSENAAEPRIIRDILLVDVPPGAIAKAFIPPPPPPPPRPGRPDSSVMFQTLIPSPTLPNISPDQFRLRRWNTTAMTFEPMEWTPDLITYRDSLATRFVGFQIDKLRQGGRGGRGEPSFSLSSGDDGTLVSPVTMFEQGPDRNGPPRVTVLGFTLVRLNEEVVKQSLLASLTARHFHGDNEEVDYRVAVISHDDPPKLIWESETGAAKTIGNAPDVKQDFMSPRPDQMFIYARNGAERAGANQPVRTENIVVSMIDGHEEVRKGGTRVVMQGGGGRAGVGSYMGRWTLLAQHRAGSLEAAVAGVRMRNLMLSSGILFLLTISVGLIVVSTRRAEALARQQMEFVATVSHELRTPVSVIGAAAGNLADGVVGDPQRVRKYGETIQAEARRLAETVERVLQLAGIAAGRAAAAQGHVHPLDLVNDSLQFCKTEIDAADFTVSTQVPADLPQVVGDVAALRSALQNLISNAVKYGGADRWMRVAARLDSNNRMVIFGVEDHGMGINAEDRQHIFEPFYRGREAVSRQIRGSGLGLNLVQRIAEAHGGSVSVSSEAGKGSTFSIALPASDAQSQVQSSEFKTVEAN